MTGQQSVAVIAALLAIAVLLGGWLYRRGRPYGTAWLTLHKLAALAAAVLVAAAMKDLYLQARLSLVVIGVAAVSYLAAGISGGLLSTNRPPAAAVRLVHWAAPIVAVILTVVALYLLVTGLNH